MSEDHILMLDMEKDKQGVLYKLIFNFTEKSTVRVEYNDSASHLCTITRQQANILRDWLTSWLFYRMSQ